MLSPELGRLGRAVEQLFQGLLWGFPVVWAGTLLMGCAGQWSSPEGRRLQRNWSQGAPRHGHHCDGFWRDSAGEAATARGHLLLAGRHCWKNPTLANSPASWAPRSRQRPRSCPHGPTLAEPDAGPAGSGERLQNSAPGLQSREGKVAWRWEVINGELTLCSPNHRSGAEWGLPCAPCFPEKFHLN